LLQQQQQQTPAQKTTLAQKADAIAGLAMFPALTLMVFTRRKVGYRFLNPTRLMIMAVLLWVLAGVSTLAPVGTTTVTSATNPYTGSSQSYTVPNSSATASLYPLIIFGLLMFALGMIERYLRFRDIKRGVSWHTYSRGISWLSVLPLSDSAVKRFVEPAVCAIIGILIALLPFHFLGYYIIFAAICLFVFEAWDYEHSLNMMLDTLDSLVDSEVISGNVEYYSHPNPTQRPLDETAGIPTGIAPDIEAQIQKRRARPTLPPDNLAMPPQQPSPQQSTY